MRIIYSVFLYTLAPAVLLRLLFNGFKNPDYLARIPERFGFLPRLSISRPVIWLHAVSVGEVHAAKPLMTKFKQHFPGHQVVVTTITPTGAWHVRQTFNDQVIHLYLPYDLPYAINTFLNAVAPSILIIMETEIWPNLLHYCKKRGLPRILINARLSDKSYKGYMMLRHLSAESLSLFDHIAAQSDEDAQRFITLGANEKRVSVSGNLKFDNNVPHSAVEQAQSLRRFFSVNRPIWIAASTHDGEETLILRSFREIKEKLLDCLLIIAPRHPERFDDVYQLCRNSDFATIKRSEDHAYSERTDVYIVDTLGELPVFYGCADVAFIGGSLVPGGGHNMLEAASLGTPLITGNHTFNFREIMGLLKDANAAIIVSNVDELVASVYELLTDANLRHSYGERGRRVVEENKGAIDSIMVLLNEYINSG